MDRPADLARTLVVRLWLPDRPGALGQVASRIGAVHGDVTAIVSTLAVIALTVVVLVDAARTRPSPAEMSPDQV